jgi:hypothetical protein
VCDLYGTTHKTCDPRWFEERLTQPDEWFRLFVEERAAMKNLANRYKSLIQFVYSQCTYA